MCFVFKSCQFNCILYCLCTKYKFDLYHQMLEENLTENLQIKCQCVVYINSILANANKKSKFSRLTLSTRQKTLSIVPINQPKQQKIILQLSELRNIHQKFIAQGKMTLQFAQKNQNQNPQENKGYKIKAQVFIEDASSKNLELLIKKITQIKKKMAQQKKSSEVNIKNATKNNSQHTSQIRITQKKAKTSSTQISVNRKKMPTNQKSFDNLLPTKNNEREKDINHFNRKSLMIQAKQTPFQRKLKETTTHMIIQTRKQLDILDILPTIIIEQIFSFCSLSLSHRLINKKFSTFVLKNIESLRFQQEVDEQTFLKLSKYAINIYGRLKNVRNIQLVDRFNDTQLIKNRAKSLYFGNWKQMSQKNIRSLEGLRIYALQLPYNAKFSFNCLYGLKLRHLQFISSNHITVPNPMARHQYFLIIMKQMRQLQHFMIPFLEANTIKELTAQKLKLETLKTLKVYTVNVTSSEISKNGLTNNNWYDFDSYQKLTSLKISRVLQDGKFRFGFYYKMTFPPNLEELQVGSFIDKSILKQLPLSVKYLKLIGQDFINYDILDMYLPNLKVLDVSQCPHVSPNSLENTSDIRVYSNWDRQTIHFWSNAYRDRNITLFSFKN